MGKLWHGPQLRSQSPAPLLGTLEPAFPGHSVVSTYSMPVMGVDVLRQPEKKVECPMRRLFLPGHLLLSGREGLGFVMAFLVFLNILNSVYEPLGP